MKVLDRYLGQAVALPERVAPGRFRLIKSACLNGDIHLKAGELVFADGREGCHIDELDRVFETHGKEHSADLDLLSPAMATLGQFIREEVEKGLSPLLPAKVGDLAELTQLDKTLQEHLHHLQEINLRPRLNMHYEAEVSPLSRARRIAPAAVTRLASHSEDWHRRTFSGIQPKRILALYSEDEWAIYENRVFARLLDKLDKYLNKREEEVRRLEETYQDALNLGKSAHLDYRLRDSLCKLWGDAVTVGETSHLLTLAGKTIDVVRRLGKMVKVLRQSDLYRHIPRNAYVSEQLRDTNILQHDAHYRHLRTLWLLHQKEAAKAEASPVELHERNRHLFENYVLYVGMLVRRVLSENKLIKALEFPPKGGALVGARFEFAGSTATLTHKEDDWVLDYRGDKLTIVPALTPAPEFTTYGTANNRRVPVFLFRVASTSADNDQITDLVVNPLEFYGLERIRKIVDSFLWRSVFASYAKQLCRLPRAVEACLLDQGGTKAADSQCVTLTTPLRPDQKMAVDAMLQSGHGINPETKAEIHLQIANLQAIATCRCGASAQLTPRDRGFIANCSCGAEWSLDSRSGNRTGRFTISSAVLPTFETHGAWHFEFID